MPFAIVFAKSVAVDLAGLRPFDRKLVLDRIDEQLIHHPNQQTRNKKILVGLVPPWGSVEPVWELRIGELRAFYDVDEGASRVTIRAVRRKPPHLTIGDIL